MFYDVRRTSKLKQSLTGRELYDLLGILANRTPCKLESKFVLDLDGVQTWNLGLSFRFKSRDLILRTGENLENSGINLNEQYSTYGLGSYDWHTNKNRGEYNLERVIRNVKSFHSVFELILLKFWADKTK